jgi:C4-dicarboxylate-specific signal transduction histidine kinase
MMPAISQPSTTVSAGPEDAGRPALVLVVEDDAALLTLIEKRLAGSGYRTIGVADGLSALAWLKQHTPNLMLLDYSLPDMRAGQLLQQIAAEASRVPFVVATGHGSESVAVEMMKQGAYDYLVKGPAFMKLLPAVVERSLERARQAERLARAEEQLRQAHDELEQRVRQRTAELAEVNRRLRLEMDERRRAEEQVHRHRAELAHVARLSIAGEMMAELTHELNQPLSAISSYSQACLRLLYSDRREDREELLSSLHQVGVQADRAAEIVRRLRRFVTKAKPVQTAVDINALVREVAELICIDARMAQAEVRFELAESLPLVLADRIQIEQVLVNLIRNALEAMRESPAGSRRLTIRTAFDRANCIVVDLGDSGSGIPAEVIDHIFERFFTTKPNGMGMGLAISQSIIESHGGKLWATPNATRGSTFHFTLPINGGASSHGN